MHIIPVIDIYQGQVVHAVRGEREHYQPVRSGLCEGSDPSAIVQALLKVYPFTTLYIADLDSIRGNAVNDRVVDQLQQQFPHLVFWLDAGKYTKEDFSDTHNASIIKVIGSETGVEPDFLLELKDISPEPVLSLDFKKAVFSGNTGLLQRPDVWPQNIIIMNLARVGSSEGPDIELLIKTNALSTGKNIYMAGGIRNINDLQILKHAGVAGALVATALHNGSLTHQEISILK
jgi:phosphoribosylformimino-5-aminoimidazole carboxamide ribotide isomerase